jgi:hypothetical protein
VATPSGAKTGSLKATIGDLVVLNGSVAQPRLKMLARIPFVIAAAVIPLALSATATYIDILASVLWRAI